MIGQTISHYRIVARIGAGGMGVVYRAQDLTLDRPVALKFLPPHLSADPEARRRFVHEAKAAAALDHSGICTVHEVGEADGQPFIAMALLEGETLRERIARGPLPIAETLAIATQVAEALQEAHGKGIVHRDVKPANVMITPKGQAKVMDFGLAQLGDASRVTQSGTTLGTFAYMSPEQARGEAVDRRADIWSLGVMLYEMVSGRRPFPGEREAALLYGIQHGEAEPLTGVRTGVPLELERVVDKSLAKSPDLRYQHADELAADLRRIALETTEGRTRTAFSDFAAARPVRSGRRRALRWGLPISAALLVAVFLLLRPVLFDEILASAPKPIAVIAFENRTGDAGYDHLCEAIPNLLITSLEQSKYLRVVTWERLRDLLRQIGRTETTTIDQETGFAVCRAAGVGTVVLGSFTRAGELFATDVKVLDVESKQLLAGASARGRGVDSILERQIDELSHKIAKTAGLSERKVAATARPVAEVTTTSLEAYGWYLRGGREIERMYFADAAHCLEQAVAIDSTFAMANLYLGWVYQRMGPEVKSNRAFAQAKRFAPAATKREQFYIDALCAQMLERDEKRAIPIWRELLARYPEEKRARFWLGTCYRGLGRHQEAIDAFEEVLALDQTYGPALNLIAYTHMEAGDFEAALDCFQRYAAVAPGDANPLDSMGELYFHLGRLDEAAAKYEEVVRIKPEFGAQRPLSLISALREDWPQARAWIDSYILSARRAGRASEGYYIKGWHLAQRGHTSEALRAQDEAAATLEAEGDDPREYDADRAQAHAVVRLSRGEIGLARRELAQALASAGRRSGLAERDGIQASCALLLCLCELREGRAAAARDALQEARGFLPSRDAPAKRSWTAYLPNLCGLLEAELLLLEGQPAAAVRAAGSAPPLGSLFMETWNVVMHNFPVERDVAARAHLRLGETAEAIAEYERLVTFDPSRPERLIVAPIYRYRLAKLYAAQGRAGEAAAQYEKFLAAADGADIWQAELAEARRGARRPAGVTEPASR